MKELLQKALMSGLLRKITANEFVVLFGYVCGMVDDIAFEYLFNLSDRTMRRLNGHLNELGLLDKDGIQYKLNVDNTQAFLQQFVDSTKIEDKSSVEYKSSVEDKSSISERNSTDVKFTMNDIPTDVLEDSHKPTFQAKWGDVDPWTLDDEKARELVEDMLADADADDDDVSDKFEPDPNHDGIYRPNAKLRSQVISAPSYPSIELDGVEDKLSYMKDYFKELHSYPNGGDEWIFALNALKEACGGFTDCLEHFEVNLGEHTIKTKQ